MSNLQANHDQMIQIWRSFRATWDATRESWKDTDRDQFEREHIYEIAQATNAYISSLKRLSETVQRILNEAP